MRIPKSLARLVRPPHVGPDSVVSGSVLLHQPPVLLVKPRPRPLGPVPYLASRFPGAPLVFLRQLTWSYDGWPAAAVLALQHRRFKRRHPKARLVVLANTEAVARRLTALGADAIFASSNMFVDERLFRPIPGRPKLYDAIYNAQLNPYKRHALARAIPSCAYLTYLPTFQDAGARHARIARFLAELPEGHVVLNEQVDGNFRLMREEDVNEALCSAHVGLCLSRREGQMYASVEYLLAGTPVVTTPNQGGRDVYLHPDVSITARDDPRDIRDAVAALKARAIPPEVVRATTLRLVERDRDRFNRFIEGIGEGRREGSDPRWSFHFVHKLVVHTPMAGIEATIAAALENRRESERASG